MDESPSNVVLEFTGSVSFNTISSLLPKLKENIDALGEKVNTYKRLLTISIEILENCYRYVESKNYLKNYQDDYPQYFKIHKIESGFFVESGNTILKEDMSIISEKIDKVNSLDENGLRELYKMTIANGQFSEVGGAGLGYIEIAKAAGCKIHYSFENIKQDVYYYKLKLEVKP